MNDPDPLDRFVDETRSFRWAAALRTVGWLAVVAYALQVLVQIRRAAAIRESSFEDGVWGQRMEMLSFVSFPQNLLAFAVAALCAIAAAFLTATRADRNELDIGLLLRAIDIASYVVIAMAVLGVVDVFWQGWDPLGSIVLLLRYASGSLLAIGAIRLVHEAERPA